MAAPLTKTEQSIADREKKTREAAKPRRRAKQAVTGKPKAKKVDA